MEIKNATIKNAELSIQRGGILSSYLQVEYGDGMVQFFGGYALYLDESFDHHQKQSIAGYHLFEIMKIAEVKKWEDLKGKNIRVKLEGDNMFDKKIVEIGHICKDNWFCPKEK